MKAPKVIDKLIGSGNQYEQKMWLYVATDEGIPEEDILAWALAHSPRKGYVLDEIRRTIREVEVPPPPRKFDEPFAAPTRVSRPVLQLMYVSRTPQNTPWGGAAIWSVGGKDVLDVGDNLKRALDERRAGLVLPA